MKRRTFLKISSGTLAAAGLSNILKAQDAEETPYIYKYTNTTTKTDYAVTFYLTGFSRFRTADLKTKTIILEVTKADAAGVKMSGKYESELISCEQDAETKSKFLAKGNTLKLVSGNEVLPADFPKKITIIAYLTNSLTSNYFSFLKEDGNIYLEAKAPGSADYDYDLYEGCFLTTACVENKGLNDNCYELETLRDFRDNYMRSMPEGEHLVNAYYQMGPAVVAAINRRGDTTTIYDHIYDTLILPALEMIETHNYPAAMAYYKDYVVELHRLLNISKISKS